MEIGTRVGAICSASEDTVKLFGYGTYEGNEVPPEDVCIFFSKAGITNPKIRLDNGVTVWGCECWWGGLEKVKEIIGERQIVIVSPSRS